MATDLDTRPDEDQDRIQQHYNEQFGALTSAEHQAKSGIPGNVGDEAESGFFRNEDTYSGSAKSPSSKDQKTSAPDGGGLYNSEDGVTSKRSRFFSRKNRKGIAGGLLGLGFGGGGLLIFSTFVGPFQALNYGNILGKPQLPQHNAVAGRLTKEIRFAKTGNIGETRLSNYGSWRNKKLQSDFAKQGVKIEPNKLTGQMERITIDLEKSARYSSMTPDEAAKAFAKDNGITQDKVTKVKGGIRADVASLKSSGKRSLLKGFITDQNANAIAAHMRLRTVGNFYNAPSWFHPLRKVAVAGDAKISAAVAKQTAKANEESRIKKLADKSAKIKAFNSEVRGRLKPGVVKSVGGALIATAAICVAKDVADAVPEINRYNVVVPAVQSTGDAIGVADQVAAGNDVDLFAVGAYLDNLKDKDGKTAWQSEGIQKLQDPSKSGGQPIDSGLGQAFSPDSNSKKVSATLNSWGAGGLCSAAGQVTQAFVGLGLLLTGTGGLIEKGVQVGVSAAVGYGIGVLSEHLAEYIAEDPVTGTDHQGPKGGNLDAYGALELASSAARLQGGSILSANETKQLAAAQEKDDKEAFASKSFIARVFDGRDYNSLAGRVIDSQDPNAVSSVSSMFSSALGSFNRIGTVFSNLSSTFVPKVAAESPTNGWFDMGYNIQQYGFSESDLDSSLVENPYDNADTLATALGNPESDTYKNTSSRMKTCFGVELARDGEDKLTVVTSSEDIQDADGGPNPSSQEYDDANCSDKSELWTRVRFFVLDMSSLAAYNCYDGDDEACSDIGIDTSPVATAATGAGTKLRIATMNVLHSDSNNASARMAKEAEFIKSHNFDVVGLQELEGGRAVTQRTDMLKGLGSDWDIWPGRKTKNKDNSASNSIVWNTTRYELSDGGLSTDKIRPDGTSLKPDQQYHYFGDSDILAVPWVKLKDKQTGQEFIVQNTHDPTDLHGGSKDIRNRDAKLHLADTQMWAKLGLPVFITGDLNSTFYTRTDNSGADDYSERAKLPYCIFTSTGELLNSYDVFKKIGSPVGKNCPSPQNDKQRRVLGSLAGDYGNWVDHIYLTPQIQITDLKRDNTFMNARPKVTDHPILWIDAVIPGSGSSATTGSFYAASYNIEHAVSFPNADCFTKNEPKKTGDYEHGYIRPLCIERRSSAQADIISGRNGSTNPKLDIVGLQEVSQPQYTALKKKLTSYDAVPSRAKLSAARGTAIFWDITKFKKLSEGTLKTYDNAGDLRDIPWVQLSAGGKSIYVISVHAQNNDNGGSVVKRAKMESDVVAWAKTKKSATSSVLVMGDFNVGEDRNNPSTRDTAYCTMTADLVLFKLFDFAKNPSINKACPSPITNNPDADQFRSDQIYIGPTAGMTASDWTHAPDSGVYANHISDHQPVYAKVTLSGTP